VDRLMERANELIGERITVRGSDYGIVESYFTVCDGYQTRYVLCTDIGKRVELSSFLRYLNSLITTAVRPDGSDYAQRCAQPKGLYRANAVCVANIDNNARIGNETINISNRPGN